MEGCARSELALRISPGAVLRLSANGTGELADLDLQVGFARLTLVSRRVVRSTPASADKPNLVLFVMDTLRADRTSAYGYSKPTTPALEALALRGTKFESAYSTAPWTWPSTASLLTGLTPQSHGVLDFYSSYLASSLETLPEAALRAGLRTGAFIGNPLIVGQRNFDQGFHHFRSTRATQLLDTDVLVPEAIDWLDEAARGRFMLYVQAMEPHDFLPYTRRVFPARKPPAYPSVGMVGVRTNLLRKRSAFLGGARQTGLRSGKWKVILAEREDGFDGAEQDGNLRRAFDLESDPSESSALDARELRGLFETLVGADAADQAKQPEQLTEPGEDTRQVLLNLGYLESDEDL